MTKESEDITRKDYINAVGFTLLVVGMGGAYAIMFIRQFSEQPIISSLILVGLIGLVLWFRA